MERKAKKFYVKFTWRQTPQAFSFYARNITEAKAYASHLLRERIKTYSVLTEQEYLKNPVKVGESMYKMNSIRGSNFQRYDPERKAWCRYKLSQIDGSEMLMEVKQIRTHEPFFKHYIDEDDEPTRVQLKKLGYNLTDKS